MKDDTSTRTHDPAGKSPEGIARRLRESEERYRAFVTASSDVVYRMSPDWSEMRQLDGRGFLADTPEPDEDWREKYILEADRERVETAIQKAIRTKGMFELEHSVVRADGTPGWTISRAVPIIGSDGEIVEWLGAAKDVTERKRAEDALRASEERLSNVLEGMDECFGLMDHELRIITQNKAALAIDGRPLRKIQGRTHSDVYPNADPAIEALYHRALVEGRPVSLDHRYGWQDGRASWLEMRAFPVPEGLAVFWRDISERKRYETRLKESEERFRLVADNISQLAWTCDSLGNVNWYNQRWLDYTGLSFDDMKSWGWEKVQHPEHAERVVAGVKRAAASGEPWEDTFPLRRHDGEYRWFYSRAMPIRDERGDIVQWFGTNTDVTDRFEAEEKLRDSERHQRTLLAELQHRVRNTLAVVRSIARRTAERSDSTEDMISHFEGRLSAFSRIQSVVTRSPERGVDLKSLIEDELLAVTAHDGHTLRAKGPEIVLRSRAAESVSLAIHELATNAVKYGALTIASGRIQVRWDRVDDDDGARLDLEWLESGLGYAPKPTREGFGHELLKRSLPYELQARTNIEFTDDGLRFTLTMPLSSDMVVGAERND